MKLHILIFLCPTISLQTSCSIGTARWRSETSVSSRPWSKTTRRTRGRGEATQEPRLTWLLSRWAQMWGDLLIFCKSKWFLLMLLFSWQRNRILNDRKVDIFALGLIYFELLWNIPTIDDKNKVCWSKTFFLFYDYLALFINWKQKVYYYLFGLLKKVKIPSEYFPNLVGGLHKY